MSKIIIVCFSFIHLLKHGSWDLPEREIFQETGKEVLGMSRRRQICSVESEGDEGWTEVYRSQSLSTNRPGDRRSKGHVDKCQLLLVSVIRK